MFASFSYANGYEIPDSLKNGDQDIQKGQIQDKGNQDSVNQAESGGQKKSDDKKRIDVFIDRDGDGISDSRQDGMSFDKLRKKTMKKRGIGASGGNGGPSNGPRTR